MKTTLPLLTLVSAALIVAAPAPFVKPGPVVTDATAGLSLPSTDFGRRGLVDFNKREKAQDAQAAAAQVADPAAQVADPAAQQAADAQQQANAKGKKQKQKNNAKAKKAKAAQEAAAAAAAQQAAAGSKFFQCLIQSNH
jgi:hypothetical protein